LLFSIIYALGRGIFRVKPKMEQDKPFATRLQFALAIILMASLTFLVRYFYPNSTGNFGMIFGDYCSSQQHGTIDIYHNRCMINNYDQKKDIFSTHNRTATPAIV
ncbi:MAG: hypothetical protein MUP90_14625, partial [Gammaproteobacteria bacterium]|nr:hypothetical protein [Gammaproteobacteria bacterium]